MEAVQTIEIKEINDAELYVDPKINAFANIAVDPIRQLCLAADKQVIFLFTDMLFSEEAFDIVRTQ